MPRGSSSLSNPSSSRTNWTNGISRNENSPLTYSELREFNEGLQEKKEIDEIPEDNSSSSSHDSFEDMKLELLKFEPQNKLCLSEKKFSKLTQGSISSIRSSNLSIMITRIDGSMEKGAAIRRNTTRSVFNFSDSGRRSPGLYSKQYSSNTHYSFSSFPTEMKVSRPELSAQQNERCRAAIKFLHKIVERMKIFSQNKLFQSRSDIESMRSLQNRTHEGNSQKLLRQLQQIGEVEEADNEDVQITQEYEKHMQNVLSSLVVDPQLEIQKQEVSLWWDWKDLYPEEFRVQRVRSEPVEFIGKYKRKKEEVKEEKEKRKLERREDSIFNFSKSLSKEVREIVRRENKLGRINDQSRRDDE